MMSRRIIPWTEQRARADELDKIRCQRRLTAEEQAEADRLLSRLYMREWRARNYGMRGSAR